MEEKKCKSCAMMIPKDANICPHCRKKQGVSACAVALAILGVLFLVGYIAGGGPSNYLNSTTSPAASRKSTPQIDATQLTEKGKKIKAKHPQWSNEICNVIGEKRIRIGMTAEQVIAAWGKPHKINTTVGSWGKHEQWVVHASIDSDYLYFENGKLTSIQQSR